MPSETNIVVVDAILFDMDGTLIDSTPGVFKAWETFSKDYSLGNSHTMVEATHGRRLYDTLKEYCGIQDQTRLLAEIDRFEDEVIRGGPMPLPGVEKLVSQLTSFPEAKWTIVTSASSNYAPRALERSGITIPQVGLVTANDVSYGKPHPAPYLAGAAKCGVEASKCLVVEDAISGLNSGRAAGARTLAVCTSTAREILEAEVKPDWIVNDLESVSVEMVGGKIKVTIGNP